MTSLNSKPDLEAEKVNELARGFWYSAILRAGIKLHVFSHLENGSFTFEALAHRLGASPRYLQAFLDSCVTLGLLDKVGNNYINSSLSAKFLVKGKPGYVGDHALHHTNTWASWGMLDEIILKGEIALPFETGFVDAETYWTDYMMGQHNRAASGQAYYLVQNLNLSNNRKLIDLGGGAGSYSIALCDAYPQLAAVVVDRKEPLAIARRLVKEHDLQGQISCLEGDIFETDLGNDYDVALISGVVLITPEEACRRIIKLAYEVLRPGGTIVIQDYMRVDHGTERAKLDALEDLYVLVAFSPGAGDREGEEVVSWLVEAGFQNPKMIPLPTQLALITAEKI